MVETARTSTTTANDTFGVVRNKKHHEGLISKIKRKKMEHDMKKGKIAPSATASTVPPVAATTATTTTTTGASRIGDGGVMFEPSASSIGGQPIPITHMERKSSLPLATNEIAVPPLNAQPTRSASLSPLSPSSNVADGHHHHQHHHHRHTHRTHNEQDALLHDGEFDKKDRLGPVYSAPLVSQVATTVAPPAATTTTTTTKSKVVEKEDLPAKKRTRVTEEEVIDVQPRHQHLEHSVPLQPSFTPEAIVTGEYINVPNDKLSLVDALHMSPTTGAPTTSARTMSSSFDNDALLFDREDLRRGMGIEDELQDLSLNNNFGNSTL